MNKFDIQVKGNSIGGRQGWAYICNSGEVTVLKANLDLPQEYEDYKTFGNVRVTWNYSGQKHYKTCQFAKNKCNREVARWELTSGGSCLSSSFGLHDAIEMIEDSQSQVVNENDVVAIASYSKETAYIQLYRVGKVDICCETVAVLNPLTEEEMQEVVAHANKWCR